MKLSSVLAAALFGSSMVVSLSSSSVATSTKPVFQLAQRPVMYCSVKTSGGRLNIRETPSTRSRIIGKVRNGELVSVAATNGSEGREWTKIIHPQVGYVANVYLTKCREV